VDPFVAETGVELLSKAAGEHEEESSEEQSKQRCDSKDIPEFRNPLTSGK